MTTTGECVLRRMRGSAMSGGSQTHAIPFSAESAFKALALAIKEAVSRTGLDDVPSTKGTSRRGVGEAASDMLHGLTMGPHRRPVVGTILSPLLHVQLCNTMTIILLNSCLAKRRLELSNTLLLIGRQGSNLLRGELEDLC